MLRRISLLGVMLHAQGGREAPVPFTQADKERLIRIEITLENFMKATEQRFQAVEKRLDQLEVRMDRLEARMDRLETRMDRMEDRTLTLNLTIMGLLVGLFGYLVWDRWRLNRYLTQRPGTLRQLESQIRDYTATQEAILAVLREMARSDERLAQTLRNHRLL